jgi:hypothetical protein
MEAVVLGSRSRSSSDNGSEAFESMRTPLMLLALVAYFGRGCAGKGVAEPSLTLVVPFAPGGGADLL